MSPRGDSKGDEERPDPHVGLFLGEPTRDLEHWAWLWTGDHQFPIRSHRGLWGRVLVFVKRLLRPLLRSVLADLWDRQRVYNLILLETVAHAREVQQSHQKAIEDHARLLESLDRRLAGSMSDVMRHNDALFSRLDWKLDHYRREAKDLWHRLGALIAATDSVSLGGSKGRRDGDRTGELRRVQQEQEYLELERRYRGCEEEIAERVAIYLPHLAKAPGKVLDIGCGRGEALEVFAQNGIAGRGIDSNGEMIATCRDKGLEAEVADLFEHLQSVEEGSLGGVVSFHVIEHLPAESVERLVRLAWRALAADGVLILETPSPLSMTMAARDFWIDPTHRRPVHPASLEVTFHEAGFAPVHRLDLHPFPDEERLPEIDPSSLVEGQRELADHVNRMRDILDDLLFGCRDFAMIGVKPS